jgi:hypothetical protein
MSAWHDRQGTVIAGLSYYRETRERPACSPAQNGMQQPHMAHIVREGLSTHVVEMDVLVRYGVCHDPRIACVVPKGATMFGSRSLKSMALTSVLAGSLLVGGGGMVLAQDEETTGPAFPNHIHAGTCDELDPNPIAPLENITAWLNDTDDETENAPQGVLTAAMVYRGETDVDLSLEDILAESHSINVHESEENIQNYIACGEIGGVVVDDDGETLVVALRPMNDSGYFGLAFLEGGDDGTNVKVWLAEPAAAPDVEATPVS